MAWLTDFTDLTRRTVFDTISHGKAFTIYKNSKYNGFELGLASMVYTFFW